MLEKIGVAGSDSSVLRELVRDSRGPPAAVLGWAGLDWAGLGWTGGRGNLT